MMQWLDEEMDTFDDDSELLGELFDQLPQGVKDGNTAHQALLLAELADDKLVSPAVRAALIVTLAEAGTIGQRDAAIDPDGYANADMVLLAQVREAAKRRLRACSPTGRTSPRSYGSRLPCWPLPARLPTGFLRSDARRPNSLWLLAPLRSPWLLPWLRTTKWRSSPHWAISPSILTTTLMRWERPKRRCRAGG